MQTYAEYLNTMTVKQLNAIAREMVKRDAMLKGYSKLRKAALIKALMESMQIDHMEALSMNNVKILNTEAPADHDAILKIMAEVLPIEFSAAPAESVAEALKDETLTETTPDDETPSLDELKHAYRHMRKTVNGMRHSASRVRCVGRLRNLSAQLKSLGVQPHLL